MLNAVIPIDNCEELEEIARKHHAIIGRALTDMAPAR
jgi:hypothetical protein